MQSYPLSQVRAAIELSKNTGISVQTALWAVDPDPMVQEANLALLQRAGVLVEPAAGSSPRLKNLDLSTEQPDQPQDQPVKNAVDAA